MNGRAKPGRKTPAEAMAAEIATVTSTVALEALIRRPCFVFGLSWPDRNKSSIVMGQFDSKRTRSAISSILLAPTGGRTLYAVEPRVWVELAN